MHQVEAQPGGSDVQSSSKAPVLGGDAGRRRGARVERFHLRSRTGGGSGEGAGLGLAIVDELTEAMGGTASVENLPVGGARFTIALPTWG
ncbi:MAG: hypothetical protein JJE35_12495 [Thermoleophilia bacterium]|nr:hypothetical protein [Thermoleophilia bacterium]